MSKSSTEAGTEAEVWGDQAGYLTDLYGAGSNLMASQQPENAAMMAGRDARSAYGQSPALQNLIQSSQTALSGRLNPSENPYLQRAMQSAINPLTQNYQENVLGGITDQAVQAGQTGGSRQGIAEGIAGREYLQQVGDVATNMSFQDYGAGMDRQGQAIDQAGTVANLGMMPADIMSGVGREEQLAPWQQLQLQQGLIGSPTVLGGAAGASSGGTSSALGNIL